MGQASVRELGARNNKKAAGPATNKVHDSVDSAVPANAAALVKTGNSTDDKKYWLEDDATLREHIDSAQTMAARMMTLKERLDLEKSIEVDNVSAANRSGRPMGVVTLGFVYGRLEEYFKRIVQMGRGGFATVWKCELLTNRWTLDPSSAGGDQTGRSLPPWSVSLDYARSSASSTARGVADLSSADSAALSWRGGASGAFPSWFRRMASSSRRSVKPSGDDVTTYAVKVIAKSRIAGSARSLEGTRMEVRLMKHLCPPVLSSKSQGGGTYRPYTSFSDLPFIKFYGAFEDDKSIHLVLEMCEGGELFQQICARGRYTERDAAGLVYQLLLMVRALHKHGVVHRDLKPENLLFSSKADDASLKLIDFGLSAVVEDYPEDDPEGRGGTPMPFNACVGTTLYMAPEILKQPRAERAYGREVDLWSVGVIAYILLTGRPPFWAKSENKLAQKIRDFLPDGTGVRKFHVSLDVPPWSSCDKAGNDVRDPMLDGAVRKEELQVPEEARDEAKELVRNFLDGLLDPDARTRLKVEDALKHPWIVRHLDETLDDHDNIQMDTTAATASSDTAAAVSSGENDDDDGIIVAQRSPKPFQRAQSLGRLRNRDIGHAVFAPLTKFAAHQRFRRLALRSVAATYTAAELADLTAMFADLDEDGDGTITSDEFSRAIAKAGGAMSSTDKEQMQEAFSAADMNKDGRVDYREFVAATLESCTWFKNTTEEEYSMKLLTVFKQLDKDGDGKLEEKEIAVLLDGGGFSEEERLESSRQMMDEADYSRDGSVSFEEFAWLMRRRRSSRLTEVGEGTKSTSGER